MHPTYALLVAILFPASGMVLVKAQSENSSEFDLSSGKNSPDQLKARLIRRINTQLTTIAGLLSEDGVNDAQKIVGHKAEDTLKSLLMNINSTAIPESDEGKAEVLQGFANSHWTYSNILEEFVKLFTALGDQPIDTEPADDGSLLYDIVQKYDLSKGKLHMIERALLQTEMAQALRNGEKTTEAQKVIVDTHLNYLKSIKLRLTLTQSKSVARAIIKALLANEELFAQEFQADKQ